MNSNQIRQKFLDFFQDKQHKIVPSAPIVLKDDPTLMFSNSGMTQFKDYFLGYKTPAAPRIADTQKCLRVSGKHNDLDDVGKDTYHHTMFEMLGNWSFGNYFKTEAIAWAWELLTETFKIPKENIYVTIFQGDETEKLARDTDAYNEWKKHISEDRILNGNKKDNFWEMGKTGPCGPCSEIHVDIRPLQDKEKVDGKTLVNQDHPQVIEVWNLVFMEFNRKADGSLEKLPQQHVDTGMGFERLCMVLQGKTSNYDTDVFSPLIEKVEELSGKKYNQNTPTDIAIRVVVDHLRAVVFAIADGQLPSNTGAGYVIRRILRRAISYAYRFLDQKESFIHRLLPTLVDNMGSAFPEIAQQQKLITEVIKEEEKSFLRTIEQGLVRLNHLIAQSQDSKCLNGAAVFELYDTFGFPSDLSRIIAEEKGYTIDEEGYKAEMQKQKQRSQKASASTSGDWVILDENAAEMFVGYDQTETQVNITRYREIKNKKGTFYQLVLDSTPFYAESGGQTGDTGVLVFGDEKTTVIDTKKENNLITHWVKKLPENKENLWAKVDKERRAAIMKNHTATHLLHQALRHYLGTHVEQKGSFVGADYLRFDFSHFSKLTEEELAKVNAFVNARIQEHLPLEENRAVPFQEAVNQGAMALFGEKYGEKVRTIRFGESMELCGGTHVKNTGDIFLFQITGENSTAAGIRRIEAITGQKALQYFKDFEAKYQEVAELLNQPKDLKTTLEKLLAENNKLNKEVEAFKKKEATGLRDIWKKEAVEINGVRAILVEATLDPKSVKDLVFQLKNETENTFVVVANLFNEKATISVGISEELLQSRDYHAGNLVREWAKEIKGGGGGQAAFATAGGKDSKGLNKIKGIAEQFLAK